MAFPTIPTGGRIVTANQLDTTATRTFPSLTGLTKNSGDLLIAVIVAYQSSTTNAQFSGWTAGWTELHDTGTATTLAIGVAYKWSTGSETGAITVTQAATITGDAAMAIMSIAGAHATTPPEAGTRADNTAAAADPASFDPAGWASEDTLWIAVHGNGMTAIASTWTGTGATAPTNYGSMSRLIATDTSTIGDCELAIAFRQNTASSEDVGAFTATDISNARNSSLVLAVRPAAAAAISQARFGFFNDGTETGSTLIAAEGSGANADLATGDVNMQLRVRLQETGGAAAPDATDDWQLYAERNSSGSWFQVTSSSTFVTSFDSTNLTDGAATTNRLTGGTGSFVAGKLSETGLITDLGWTVSNFTEVLYSLTIKQAGMENGDYLFFRVYRNGATTTMTYTVAPLVTAQKHIYTTPTMYPRIPA